MKYKTGHINPFWDQGYRNFTYEKQPLMPSEYDEWAKQGFHHPYVKSFSGSMYNNKNPMPHWITKLDNMFGLKNQTYLFYRMQTFEVMPPHKDHYQTYIKLFNADPKNIYRVLIMLEDWKPGHYLEIDGQGFVNWQAGDYFIWENFTPHAAANIGIDDRYTLQITGEMIVNDLILEPEKTEFSNLYWFNVKGLSEQPFFDQHFPMLKEAKGTEPTFIYLGNGYLKQLETTVLSKVDRDKNIHIYLYEPVCSYVQGTRHNQSFFSEYTFETDPNQIRVEEFDSIEIFINNNSLDKNKVFVHACEYNVEQSFPYYKDKMILLSDDLFVKNYPIFHNTNNNYNFLFQHNFICTTWRYSKHRHLVTAYLTTYNTLYNWYFKCNYSTVAENAWIDLERLRKDNPRVHSMILSGIDTLNKESPVFLDTPARSAVEVVDPKLPYYPNTELEKYETPATTNPTNLLLEKFYSISFCAVVCETRYAQHAANFSEKVYQAIQYKRPFIVVAPPKTLEAIRSYGFKTFEPFFDESYDSELNHEQRLLRIFKLFDWINSRPYNEIVELYNNMRPAIEHNFNLLVSIMKKSDDTQIIKESQWKEKN